jgi:hypothetical protein
LFVGFRWIRCAKNDGGERVSASTGIEPLQAKSAASSVDVPPLGRPPGHQAVHGLESTAGLYGDLQGIAGRNLLEIDGLELPPLDGPAARDAAE